tara:strand:+ start:5888 stop:6268 length:381 start_codon:yes stop_codon:yes gene_type:complete
MKEVSKEEKGIVQMPKQYESPEGRSCLVPEIDVFFSNIVTSAHSIKSALITKQLLSERQVVVAAGSNSSVKVGDWIKINVETFPRSSKPGGHDIGNVETIHPPFEKIGTTEYLFMTDRSIKYRIKK